MTREEIIWAISNDKMMPFIQPEQLAQIVDFVIKNYKHSLPSDLDEAAEEYAYNNWEDNDYHTGASEGLPFDAIGHTEKCFKAGAEWMAGHGEVFDGFISIKGKRSLIVIEGSSQNSKYDDNIIVQIRKKQ